MIAGTEDEDCPYATAKHMKEVIGSPVKQFTTIEGEDHMYFSYASDDFFMKAVLTALEKVDGQEPVVEEIRFLS